jgi:hypothetical protein
VGRAVEASGALPKLAMLEAASSSARCKASCELSPFWSFAAIFLDGNSSFGVGFACGVSNPRWMAEHCTFYDCTINTIDCLRFAANDQI